MTVREQGGYLRNLLSAQGDGFFRAAAGTVRAPHEYNVKAAGAYGDGSHDDLPVFRAVTDDARANASLGRPSRVVIPPGTYDFGSATTSGGLTWQWAPAVDGLEIVWQPGAVITSSVANARVLIVDGAAKPSGMASWDANEYRDAASYALTGTAAKGTTAVTCATPADAGNLAAGDWVQIATGQTITGSNEPDGETNRVLAADAGTGVVTLRWPLLATYRQENYNSGSSGTSSVGGGGSAAPYAIRKVSDRTLHKIRLVNPQFDCDVAIQAVSLWRCTDVKVEGGTIGYNWLGLGSRDTRFCEIAGTRFEHTSDGQVLGYAVGPSTGCANWNVHGFEVVSDASSYLHVHEGVKLSRFSRGSVHAGNAVDASNGILVGVAGRCYDVTIDRLSLAVNCPVECNAVTVDNLCTGGGNVLRNVRVVAGNAAANIKCDADGWSGFETCEVTNGRISLRAAQLGKGHDTGIRVLSGWVLAPSQVAPALGRLPRNAHPLRVSVYVKTAFDPGLGAAADTLDDADGTALTAHTPSGGGAWAKHAAASTNTAAPTIDGNRVHGENAATTSLYTLGNPHTANYTVSAKVVMRSDNNLSIIGPVGRVVAGVVTYYHARYNTGTNAWQLFKWVNNSATQLGSDQAQVLVVDQNYTCVLSMNGTTIAMIVDGVTLVSVTDSSIAAAGSAGIRLNGAATSTTGLHLDDYAVTALDDNLRLGHAADDDAYGTVTPLSSTGTKIMASGVGLLMPEETAARDVVATYAYDGAAPSTGEAFVALEYALAARRD